MSRLTLAGLLITAVAVGCTGPSSSAPADVPWADYAPSVRTEIDEAAKSLDCPRLQTAFDTADANNASTLSRTGHNNAELMKYIDAKLRVAGCY